MMRFMFTTLALTMAGLLCATNLPAGGTQDYAVIVKKVEVKTTNKDGNSWDINDGKPDIVVSVRNDSNKENKAYHTPEKTDTFVAEFNEVTNVKVRQGQTLEFHVVDKDVAANDDIGKVTRQITDKILSEGKIRLENFDQVIYLEVEFKKL